MKSIYRFSVLMMSVFSMALLFGSCEKNGLEKGGSWLEVNGERDYHFFTKVVTYTQYSSDGWNGWSCEFMVGESSTSIGGINILSIATWHKYNSSDPSGIFQLTSDQEELNASHDREEDEPGYVCTLCGSDCRIEIMDGFTPVVYDIISGTMEVGKSDEEWTFKIKGMYADENGDPKPFAFNYVGEVQVTEFLY